MTIEINELSFNIETGKRNNKNRTAVVFLHGFSGNANDWNYFAENLHKDFFPVAIDLIGHGKSSSPNEIKNYTVQAQVNYLKKILEKLKIDNPVLTGYSMGGRLATAYSVQYHKKVKALILESTAFGYKTEAERKQRILNDTKLAERIKKTSLNNFFDYWYDIDLFESLRANKNVSLNKLKNEKTKTNNGTGLANSLLGFGTGAMENHFEKIKNFENKVLLITGKLDNKFTQIAKEAKNIFPNAEHEIVNNCGHNVHLEKPQEFLKLLNEFLSNVKEKR